MVGSFSVLWFLALPLLAQTDHIKDTGRLPDHPRLLLLKGEETAIKKAIASEAIWKEIHERIVAESNAVLETAPVERVVVGRRLLAKSRECLRRVFLLSYVWRMTGDEKYARRAERELVAVSRFSDWNPTHFLDVAEMTMATAIGYDWLNSVLSDDTRRIIREAIVRKGLEPSLESRYSGWLRASHNWNQVCNAGMTYGAIAVFEDQPELARRIINRSIDSIPLAMADYGPDGAYPEGYGYWGYGTNFNVLFLTAVQKAFGKDFGLSDTPGFKRTAAYLLHMVGPTGACFNYSDSGQRGGLNPAMFWFANQLDDYSLLWLEKDYVKKDGSVARDRLLRRFHAQADRRHRVGARRAPHPADWTHLYQPAHHNHHVHRHAADRRAAVWLPPYWRCAAGAGAGAAHAYRAVWLWHGLCRDRAADA